jgi:DNA-binding NarL/FixJ family response regulator
VAEDAGWTRGDRDGADVVVTNQLHSATADHPVGVLVVAPEPAHCQAGVRAVAHGHVSVLLSADDPEELPAALQAAASGYVLMPKRLVDAANQVPPLDDRLIRTLLLVADGRSNIAIARALHESESTAKRDIATLLRLLSVTCRAELAQAATRLGYRRGGPRWVAS